MKYLGINLRKYTGFICLKLWNTDIVNYRPK